MSLVMCSYTWWSNRLSILFYELKNIKVEDTHLFHYLEYNIFHHHFFEFHFCTCIVLYAAHKHYMSECNPNPKNNSHLKDPESPWCKVWWSAFREILWNSYSILIQKIRDCEEHDELICATQKVRLRNVKMFLIYKTLFSNICTTNINT